MFLMQSMTRICILQAGVLAASAWCEGAGPNHTFTGGMKVTGSYLV